MSAQSEMKLVAEQHVGPGENPVVTLQEVIGTLEMCSGEIGGTAGLVVGTMSSYLKIVGFERVPERWTRCRAEVVIRFP